MRSLLIIIGLLLFSFPAAGKTTLLTWDTIYNNPFASVSAPEIGANVYPESKSTIHSKIGKGFGLITHRRGEYNSQLAIEASTWFTLKSRGRDAFSLICEDLTLSMPLVLKFRQATFIFKWNHTSAHQGDGSEVPAIVYSRDYFTLHYYRDFSFDWYMKGRLYLHTGYIYRVFPQELDRFFYGGGIENIITSVIPFWYTALEINRNQDTHSTDISAQAGFILEKSKIGKGVEARVAITAYRGKDRRGQMLGRDFNRFGIGVFFR